MSRNDIEVEYVIYKVKAVTGIPVLSVYRPKIFSLKVKIYLILRSMKVWVVWLRCGKEVVVITTREDTVLFRREGLYLIPYREVA